MIGGTKIVHRHTHTHTDTHTHRHTHRHTHTGCLSYKSFFFQKRNKTKKEVEKKGIEWLELTEQEFSNYRERWSFCSVLDPLASEKIEGGGV